MAAIISKDTPLAEITLRKYEKPDSLDERSLIRKLCLSIGLLQPGDSRDIIVDILQVLVDMQRKKKMLNSEEIRYEVAKNRKKRKMALAGVASSNIRRQLLRLRDMFIVEKVANNYRINENASLADIFTEKIEKYYLESIKERVKEYFQEVNRNV
jgi:hypothetical protein